MTKILQCPDLMGSHQIFRLLLHSTFIRDDTESSRPGHLFDYMQFLDFRSRNDTNLSAAVFHEGSIKDLPGPICAAVTDGSACIIARSSSASENRLDSYIVVGLVRVLEAGYEGSRPVHLAWLKPSSSVSDQDNRIIGTIERTFDHAINCIRASKGLAPIRVVFQQWQLPVCAQSVTDANRVRKPLLLLLDQHMNDVNSGGGQCTAGSRKLLASKVAWGDKVKLPLLWKQGASNFYDQLSKSAGRTAPYATVWDCFLAELLLCVLSVWMAGDGEELKTPRRHVYDILGNASLQAQNSHAEISQMYLDLQVDETSDIVGE
ncbi:hypothetical protein NCC49_000777 [Naganishia albida]|nr:hypothetical protein NCC49_000777 [Naganishia albida]